MMGHIAQLRSAMHTCNRAMSRRYKSNLITMLSTCLATTYVLTTLAA